MQPRIAMVLAGGGARGAYEAGVLRFILGDLPLRLGRTIAPDVISGTSVGAINGSYIGAWIGQPQGAHKLSELWRGMTLDRIYRFEAMDILRSPLRLMRGTNNEQTGLVDATPLHQLIHERFPWRELHDNLDHGHLKGLAIAATEAVSGKSILFSDGFIVPGQHFQTARSRCVTTRITAEHVLASCAIPFVFPPIPIDKRSYVDGGLRQNTPLLPAIRMGASHCLVIGTKGLLEPAVAETLTDDESSVILLLGKTLNALLLDPVHHDLKRLELVNDILAAGRQAYGSDFAERLNSHLTTPLREINVLGIRPSKDLGRVAYEVWNAEAVQASRGTRMLLSTIAERAVDGEADLLSYMLFDQMFTHTIEQLGYEDAAAMEPEIVAFFASADESNSPSI